MLPLPSSWLVECCVHLPSKHRGKTHLCVFLMSGIPPRGMTIVHMYIVRNGYVEGKLEFCVPEQVILEIMGEGLERELYLKDTEADTMYWPLCCCSRVWQKCFQYQRAASLHDTRQGHNLRSHYPDLIKQSSPSSCLLWYVLWVLSRPCSYPGLLLFIYLYYFLLIVFFYIVRSVISS